MRNKFRNTDSGIKAGDLILTEQPFAFVLSSKEQGSRCDNCLEKGKVLKCSGCQFVYYCGRSCQKDAWSDHKWECANFKRVAPKVLPDGARMLAKVINRLNRGDGHSYKSYYSANSFRMWKDLMSHYSDLKADKKRMDHFTSLCVVLYEFLKDISLPNTVELMGLYGRMVINSFMILDVDLNSIGTGIYLASSILDHSCSPNAVATFDGKTINIRAIEDMPCLDWNQMRISYIDLMKSPIDRQTELRRNYYFLCQCARCMDENQTRYVHAAKCLNPECDSPVNIPWKEDCQIVIRAEKLEKGDSKSEATNLRIKNSDSKSEIANSSLTNGDSKFETANSRTINGDSKSETAYSRINNSDSKTELADSKTESEDLKPERDSEVTNNVTRENRDLITDSNGFSDLVTNSMDTCKDIVEKETIAGISCMECSTKYTQQHVDVFVKTMEFTHTHLQNMERASVAYVDVCKYCLERQAGVLHPLNVLHAQTLDHALEALIQVQLWVTACQYAEDLIPCFRFYYGERNPLLGLLHLKYGKILLYKMEISKALAQLKIAEKIIKITHGDRHPLYREQLLPLLQQAIMESS